ncbi:MAG: flippase [Clostridia bacterium]|nr:flippase [Clostridia bacterium]
MKEKQVVKNASWIIVCKVMQSVMQLVIGMISARYLGPDNYGLINYAASIVAFALPIMKLGFDAILVHELVESPEKEGEIMGTSLLANVVSSVACMIGVFGFSAIVDYGKTETIIVCVLYSLSVFFAALEMIQYWFQYKLMSKYSSIIMLIAYVFVSAYKIFLLATAKSIFWFAVSHSVEYGLIGIMLIVTYYKKGGTRLSFSFQRFRKMLRKSRPYIGAAIMVVVIQNTDHVMLTKMVGEAENGYYAAAITCAGVAQFVYTAIIDSFRPLILSSKKTDEAAYEKNLSRLYSVVTYLALAQNLVFAIGAHWMVKWLYGVEYMAAVPVLQILTWYRAFSFMGTIRNIWLLAENKQKYLPFINMFGVVCNIVLNAVMIPFFGAVGAATASLITQFAMNFGFGFIFKQIRKNNQIMMVGLNPAFLLRESKDIIRAIRKKK